MELFVYNSGSYKSIVDAFKAGSLHKMATLNIGPQSLGVNPASALNRGRLDQLEISAGAVEKALTLTDHLESYTLVVSYDGVPIAIKSLEGYAKSEWVNLPCGYDVTWKDMEIKKLYAEIRALKSNVNEELLVIEEHAPWCGPEDGRTGPEGDDVFQAVHRLRGLISMGVEEYDKRVKEAKDGKRS